MPPMLPGNSVSSTLPYLGRLQRHIVLLPLAYEDEDTPLRVLPGASRTRVGSGRSGLIFSLFLFCIIRTQERAEIHKKKIN